MASYALEKNGPSHSKEGISDSTEEKMTARDTTQQSTPSSTVCVGDKMTSEQHVPNEGDGPNDHNTSGNQGLSLDDNNLESQPSQKTETFMFNVVCAYVIERSKAQALSIYLRALHNDLSKIIEQIRKNDLTKRHPQAPSGWGEGNYYNQVLMASDRCEDRDYVLSKHLVCSLHTSVYERWNWYENGEFPFSPYFHSLWSVISTNSRGLNDSRVRDARHFFAHAFRNPGSEDGVRLQEDYPCFDAILEIHEQVLPAVKEIRDKLQDALSDTQAWTLDPDLVSDQPPYAKDCPEAESHRQQWLATRRRPNGETDRQLENHRRGLTRHPTPTEQGESPPRKTSEEAESAQSGAIWGTFPESPTPSENKKTGEAQGWTDEEWTGDECAVEGSKTEEGSFKEVAIRGKKIEKTTVKGSLADGGAAQDKEDLFR